MIAPSTIEAPSLRPRESLGELERQEMFALLDQHFEGVTRAQFDRDLDAKNWVIEVRREGRLMGFTTLLARTSRYNGDPILAIYSGDTIMAPEAWGTPALARAWIAGVNRLRADSPGHRCFWLLLTSGFRTYRFLPVFWREFFPHVGVITPPLKQLLLIELARAGYGALFNARRGIVRFPQPQRLRSGLAGVPEGRDANPHIAFFLSRNPGHADGDELACLTEISEANLTPAGQRMLATPAP